MRHRIEFESDPNLQLIREDGSLSSELVSFSEPMPIDRRPPLVIDAPLRGGPWRCGNGFGFGNSHEGIYAAKNIARLHVPQRFGCDFGKVDAEGNTLPNPFPNIISSSMFYGYGASSEIAMRSQRFPTRAKGVKAGWSLRNAVTQTFKPRSSLEALLT